MPDDYKAAVDGIKKLSVAERISVIEDIWDSIFSSNVQYPVPNEQEKELDLRLREHADNPDKAKFWEEVKKNVQSKL
jgi:putative addiction module component (TIGR02574 family)